MKIIKLQIKNIDAKCTLLSLHKSVLLRIRAIVSFNIAVAQDLTFFRIILNDIRCKLRVTVSFGKIIREWPFFSSYALGHPNCLSMVRSNISKIWSILSFLNLITDHIGREIIQIYPFDRSLVKTQRTRGQMLDMRLILSDYFQIITINHQILEHSGKIKKIKAQFKVQIYHKS